MPPKRATRAGSEKPTSRNLRANSRSLRASPSPEVTDPTPASSRGTTPTTTTATRRSSRLAHKPAPLAALPEPGSKRPRKKATASSKTPSTSFTDHTDNEEQDCALETIEDEEEDEDARPSRSKKVKVEDTRETKEMQDSSEANDAQLLAAQLSQDAHIPSPAPEAIPQPESLDAEELPQSTQVDESRNDSSGPSRSPQPSTSNETESEGLPQFTSAEESDNDDSDQSHSLQSSSYDQTERQGLPAPVDESDNNGSDQFYSSQLSTSNETEHQGLPEPAEGSENSGSDQLPQSSPSRRTELPTSEHTTALPSQKRSASDEPSTPNAKRQHTQPQSAPRIHHNSGRRSRTPAVASAEIDRALELAQVSSVSSTDNAAVSAIVSVSHFLTEAVSIVPSVEHDASSVELADEQVNQAVAGGEHALSASVEHDASRAESAEEQVVQAVASVEPALSAELADVESAQADGAAASSSSPSDDDLPVYGPLDRSQTRTASRIAAWQARHDGSVLSNAASTQAEQPDVPASPQPIDISRPPSNRPLIVGQGIFGAPLPKFRRPGPLVLDDPDKWDSGTRGGLNDMGLGYREQRPTGPYTSSVSLPKCAHADFRMWKRSDRRAVGSDRTTSGTESLQVSITKQEHADTVSDLLKLFKDLEDGRPVDSTKIIGALDPYRKQPGDEVEDKAPVSPPRITNSLQQFAPNGFEDCSHEEVDYESMPQEPATVPCPNQSVTKRLISASLAALVAGNMARSAASKIASIASPRKRRVAKNLSAVAEETSDVNGAAANGDDTVGDTGAADTNAAPADTAPANGALPVTPPRRSAATHDPIRTDGNRRNTETPRVKRRTKASTPRADAVLTGAIRKSTHDKKAASAAGLATSMNRSVSSSKTPRAGASDSRSTNEHSKGSSNRPDSEYHENPELYRSLYGSGRTVPPTRAGAVQSRTTSDAESPQSPQSPQSPLSPESPPKKPKIREVRKVVIEKTINDGSVNPFGFIDTTHIIANVRKGAELRCAKYYWVDEEYTSVTQLSASRFQDAECADVNVIKWDEADEEEESDDESVADDNNLKAAAFATPKASAPRPSLTAIINGAEHGQYMGPSAPSTCRTPLSTVEQNIVKEKNQKRNLSNFAFFSTYRGENSGISQHILDEVFGEPEKPEDRDQEMIDALHAVEIKMVKQMHPSQQTGPFGYRKRAS